MVKYLVKHAPDDSDDANHEWYVEYEDGGHLVELNGLSSGMAHVIAWALNAVAEGASLVRLGPGLLTRQQVIDADFPAERYDGPTDGVGDR